MEFIKHFEKLMEAVEYIKSQEDDTSKLRWNNAAGDWVFLVEPRVCGYFFN